MRDIFRQIVVVLSTIAVIVVNGLATTLPLGGKTTGEISDQFDVYFVPAGYVFSIWGLIYLALIGYSIFQALPAQRDNPRLRRTGWLYVLSCAANIAWIFLWHYEIFAWTLVAMVALLLALIVIYLRLGTGFSRVPAAETWLVRVPFSIYLGWITVATIANVTSLLDYLGRMVGRHHARRRHRRRLRRQHHASPSSSGPLSASPSSTRAPPSWPSPPG